MYKLDINLDSKSYPIIIKEGVFNDINNYLDSSKQIVILTDQNVFNLHLMNKTIKHDLLIIIPPGEDSKNIKLYEDIINQMLSKNISRNATLVAIGGGVIGDLGGFIAATYLRGINFLQVPTTLLAQVDSSIGGKVAINYNNYKNVIGQFYHPNIVLIDPLFLKTLSEKEFNNGVAEVIKYALIKDYDLFLKLENNNIKDNLDELIYRCLLIKKFYVENDEKDLNLRHTLNFGHTVGHALESFYDFKKYSHGEAISIGMVKMTKDNNFSERIINLLLKFDLPVRDDIAKDELYHYIKNDKKRNKNNLNIVLLNTIGDAYIENIKLTDIYKYL